MTIRHIMTQLDCGEGAARAIKALIDYPKPPHHTSHVDYILQCADVILVTSGVEYIQDKDDTMRETLGISYCNTGDTYTPTLLYDHRRHKWYCCAWGDIVERYPKRFEEPLG